MAKPGRKPKQPTLSALEHIPAVRGALRAVGLDLIIKPITFIVADKPLAQRETAEAIRGPITTLPAHAHEWQQQQVDVEEAVAAETSGRIARPPGPLPRAQREAIQRGLLADAASRKAELMANFKHDAPGSDDMNGAAVMTERIETLSEAT